MCLETEAFPRLGTSPPGSPVTLTGRAEYASGDPQINVADQANLWKVAYLGPGTRDKIWLSGISAIDIRRQMPALSNLNSPLVVS